MSAWRDYDHKADAMRYGVLYYPTVNNTPSAQDIRMERILMTRGVVDEGTRERLRTLINWEMAGRVHLFGLLYGDEDSMPEEGKKLTWRNTSGCWMPGAPLVIFQEHKYVFPSERIFAEIALALAAGVGQDG